MMEEREILTSEEVLQIIEENFGLSDYETVMKKVENGTVNANFGNYKQVPIINENKFGLIGLREFFEENNSGNNEMLSIDELKELLSESEWTQLSSDNTYNYSGFLEREMNFTTFESEEDETVVVLYSIHIGLDVRAGYTESFAVKYDDDYTAKEHLIDSFNLAYLEFTNENETCNISIDGEACSEYLRVYINDSKNNEIMNDYDDETTSIDVYDKEDCLNSVKEYLKENEINFDKDSLKIVE